MRERAGSWSQPSAPLLATQLLLWGWGFHAKWGRIKTHSSSVQKASSRQGGQVLSYSGSPGATSAAGAADSGAQLWWMARAPPAQTEPWPPLPRSLVHTQPSAKMTRFGRTLPAPWRCLLIRGQQPARPAGAQPWAAGSGPQSDGVGAASSLFPKTHAPSEQARSHRHPPRGPCWSAPLRVVMTSPSRPPGGTQVLAEQGGWDLSPGKRP